MSHLKTVRSSHIRRFSLFPLGLLIVLCVSVKPAGADPSPSTGQQVFELADWQLSELELHAASAKKKKKRKKKKKGKKKKNKKKGKKKPTETTVTKNYSGGLSVTTDTCSALDGEPSKEGSFVGSLSIDVLVSGSRARVSANEVFPALTGRADIDGFNVSGESVETIGGQQITVVNTISAQRNTPTTTIHAMTFSVTAAGVCDYVLSGTVIGPSR